jgi:putative ABC transport system permease protein
VAVKPEFQELQGLLLQQGRFLSELDCQQLAAVCLLSAESASTLFPLEDPLGQAIRIGEDRYFQVVGVLASPAAASAGNHRSSGDDGRVVYIPFDTDRARFGEIVSIDRGGGQLPEILEISQITVAVDSMDHVKPTAALIRDMIAAHHPQPDTEVTVPLELLEKAEQTQRMFGLVLSAIASISLVVGGIGIMNIMLATVTERTREIGIRRALGARRRDIIWQFVVETMILSGSGGLLGVAGGLLVALLIPYVFGISAIVQLWSPLLAFTISLLVGVAFGAYPARRAAFMDPIQALRHE